MTKECDLEKLLVRHPYLIAEEFFGRQVLRQLVYGKHRLDLAFELPQGLCIVELKKTHLTANDVRQLLRYCHAWSRSRRHTLTKYHYLIGKRPHDESGLLEAAARSRFEIRFLYLDEHIPTRLAWDAAARRYFPYDPSQYSPDYLTLTF